MSASLVGSEMCIRDSGAPSSHTHPCLTQHLAACDDRPNRARTLHIRRQLASGPAFPTDTW
eukprot:410708-Alexandrium_andersonii.AAC.1